MICELCDSDETEGGDRLCVSCRDTYGEDDAIIDRAISHRAQIRGKNDIARLIVRALTTRRVA